MNTKQKKGIPLNTTPTERQKKAVNEMVENGGIVSKAMRDAGYSKETAKTPKKLTESKGFKQVCKEAGLTEELITQCLSDDIKAKPKNRKGELELGAKILKMTDNTLKLGSDGSEIVIRQVMYNNDYKLKKDENSTFTNKTTPQNDI